MIYSTVHSFISGPFLDLLFEKIELMPTNNLATNLLVTGVISQLASYPQPLLRSVLLHPDLILQPSIRGLFTAIASLRYSYQFIISTIKLIKKSMSNHFQISKFMFFRQKLDNIMPTLPGAEEGVRTARKFLSEKLLSPHQLSRNSAKESSVSIVSSTMNQIGKYLFVPVGYVCSQLKVASQSNQENA